MRGYGNYRFAPQVERKPARLILYRGPRAVVRFHDGLTHAIPAKPLRKLDIQPEQLFMLIITRVAGDVRDVRVEPIADARPAQHAATTPKVVVRQGRKLITRKR